MPKLLLALLLLSLLPLAARAQTTVTIPARVITIPQQVITIPAQTLVVSGTTTSVGCTAPQILVNGVCTTPVITPPVGGMPKLDYVIYQNGSPVPQDDSWAMGSVNYADKSGQPQGGKADISATLAGPNGGWQPLFVPNGSTTFFDLTPYNYLVMSIKPTTDGANYWVGFAGNLDTADGVQIQIAGPGFTKYGPVPQKGQWANYKIPLTAFKMTDAKAVFKFGVAMGNFAGGTVSYFDSVGLTKN